MSTIGQETADRAERALEAVGPEELADMFTEWAERKGIRQRVTEEQYKDLVSAFGAGFSCGVGYMVGGVVAREAVMLTTHGGAVVDARENRP